MSRARIFQKKSLGQVFLTTERPCQKVRDYLLNLGVRRVVEVGPGDGILTFVLLRAGIDVLALEADPRFVERLADLQKVRDHEKLGALEIVSGDALDFRLDQWVETDKVENLAVVGNIPYNISSALLQWLLPWLSRMQAAILLTQQEFAMRLMSPAGRKSYGSLSVYAQLHADLETLDNVPKEDFFPIPKVDSLLFALRHRDRGLDIKQLRRIQGVTKSAFVNRRKKLSNAIKPIMLQQGSDPSACPIDLDLRPDAIAPEDYIALTKFLYPDDWGQSPEWL